MDDSGKLLGDIAAVTGTPNRLLHRGHIVECGPRSWHTETSRPGDSQWVMRGQVQGEFPGNTIENIYRVGCNQLHK